MSDGASDAGSSEVESPALEESVGTDEKKKKKRGFLSLFKSKDKVRGHCAYPQRAEHSRNCFDDDLQVASPCCFEGADI